MGRSSADSFSSVASHMKMALMKKMKLVLLSFKLFKRRFSKDMSILRLTRRSRTFNGVGRRGLCGCFEDDVESTSSSMTRRLQRTRSSGCAYGSKYDYDYDDVDYDDVDRRAEVFIRNFRSRLLMEREVSLKLRYSEKE